MKKIWREYGLIAVLLAIALGGYFYLGEHKQDILSYSLDAIGNRLVDLVDDADSKDRIEAAFDSFKSRVLAHEVPIDRVESIAANVLNLTTSGASLSGEEAQLVLELSTEPLTEALPAPELEEVVDDSPETPLPSVSVTAESDRTLADVGVKISALIAFAEKVDAMAPGADPVMKRHIRFTSDDGLRVEVDSVSGALWSTGSMRSLAQEIEKEQMVTWAENVAVKKEARSRMLSRHRKSMEKALKDARADAPMENANLVLLRRINGLRSKGFGAGLDSTVLNIRIDMALKEAMKNLKRLPEVKDAGAAQGVDSY
jgi:hypothetical protein